MSAPSPLYATLRAAQAKASDPNLSAWVSANAGSGKTHVLTQRVLRLLIDGVDPSRILCLTFTKAAAANMAARVFKMLAAWTALDDDALTQKLVEIGVERAPAQKLALARKLFARAIETPGGLKIQTLHAFCERLLRVFPFEANVPSGFRVIEEREADELMQAALAAAFLRASSQPELSAAIERIAALAGAEGFQALIAETLRTREEIAAYGGVEAYAKRLRKRLGLGVNETEAEFDRLMREGGGGPGRWREWARKLNLGSKTDKDRAAFLMAAAHPIGDRDAQLSIYLEAFFTQAGPPRKILLTKGAAEKFPDLGDELYEEQARLEALRDKRRAAEALSRSVDLVRVAKTVLDEYSTLKNTRGWLDFSDLVERAEKLVNRGEAAWVLYKLDRGVDHFLVDEAQDTSRAQWEILQKLTEEFLSGNAGRSRRRTFFAVGDEKQSIFSFQGAAPEMFDAMRREFSRRHAAVDLPFEPVNLHLSFRSAAKILAAVDRVFALDRVWRGVSASEEKAPPHGAFYADLPGLIEVWEPIAPEPQPEPEDWRMPLDAASRQDPAVRLAERIAATIAEWLSPHSSARVIDKATRAPRRVKPGDILILVRSRAAFYEAMTRALRRRRVAFAGADRLKLRDHIAVTDLVSAGRAALSRDDDLALAESLKSPLIGLSDDDLLEFAPRRGKKSLADALEASRFKAAAERVASWRERAKKLAPFDFYARVIGADGGRRALIARLGPEAADAIDEFLALALAFERTGSPALSAFLDEVMASDVALKRDMEAEAVDVRVMTVHAAKGLEAPIVFLPDAAGAPDGRREPKWLKLEAANETAPALFVWAAKKTEDAPAVAMARFSQAEAAAGEHRRLLYVAMTRAAERLVIAAYEGASGRKQDCWYDLIRAGLDDVLAKRPAPWAGGDFVWRFGESADTPEAAARGAEPSALALPEWLTKAAAPEFSHATLRPSSAIAATGRGGSLESREAGRLAHALLQQLPDAPPGQREARAKRFVKAHRGALDDAAKVRIVECVLGVIADPELAPLFGPNSRAEVALSGIIHYPTGEPVEFSGRIDRIAISEDAIDLIDFKSGSVLRRSDVAQLALYRAALAEIYRLPVRAWLVHLESGAKMRVSDEDLTAAIEEVEEIRARAP
jgi:ATP-dependent helicase/nuclease subunit A